MLQTLKQLKTTLPCEQFLLTGSQALKIYGLTSKASDINIILVNPTEAATEAAKELESACPIKGNDYRSTLSYHFKYGDFKVYIFVENGVVLNCPTFEGIALNPVNRIVAAKRAAGRLKDIAQLRKMASSIFSNEFLTYILDKHV